MTIIVVGLNDRTAPVDLRERLTISGCALQIALDDLRILRLSGKTSAQPSPSVDEVIILSTCNRFEVYATAHDAAEGIAHIELFLSNMLEVPIADLKVFLYSHGGDGAIGHLMRVACGLDSMVLGETQILGQVTQAFEDAHTAGATGPILSHLFSQAVHAGKRARTESPISRYTTSVSHAGALLMMAQFEQAETARVLLLGAGEMAILAAQALQRFGVKNMVFVNRTYNRAEEMANDFGGKALTWNQLDEALVWADAVICATGAPHTVIYRRGMELVLEQREGRRLVMMDIAVPRDVEDSVRELPGIQYYDIDDLQSVVDANLELRKAAVPQVEEIIRREMLRFSQWYRGRQVTPVIRNLRDWAQNVAQEEVEQTLNRLPDADERTRRVVSRMAYQLVNRLLHEPTTRLRLQAAEGNGYGYAHAIRELFALYEADEAEFRRDEAHSSHGSQSNGAAIPCSLQCILPPLADKSA